MTPLSPTRRLDHAAPLDLQFRAQVVAAEGQEVALNASAFYPQGGGQNGDCGRLEADGEHWKVTDTRLDKARGVVWHRLEPGVAPPQPGRILNGEVDADRRLRHMARHTGEHLLAQAFARVSSGFEVAAVAMRGPDCTLDLRGGPTGADALAAEALLRGVMLAGPLVLETVTVPHTELRQYPLRRSTALTGQVRLVMFREKSGELFDVSACVGTHLPLGNMAAPVTVLGLERVKAGLTRVTFRAGTEAAELLTEGWRQTRALAQEFSAGPDELPARVGALRAERDRLTAEVGALRGQLAVAYASAAPPQNVGRVTLRTLTLPDGGPLLAEVLSAVPTGEVRAAVAGTRCGIGSGAPEVNAGQLLRAALAVGGGRGGGRDTLAQGQTERPETFLAEVRRHLLQGAHLISAQPPEQKDRA